MVNGNGDYPSASRIVEVDVSDELRDSFMPYAISVLTSRAIPDVRDGLKPVQRRILYVMNQLGLRPNSSHRKSAGVVGEVMGKYHPHGDSAIYGAMVRMAQDFAMSTPLVDGRGNFGSLDDPPAAYRYTEARLASAAEPMLAGIGENAVDFSSAFDGRREEPDYLPAGLPNLLVNGASGIAVGLTTNVPPHNLGETVQAVLMFLDGRRKKLPSLDEVMAVMPAPDFPSGGTLVESEDGELKAAYESGNGTVKLQAKARVEFVTAKRGRIVFTELPYMIGPERVMERVKSHMENGKLAGVRDITDLSDRTGTRLQVDCKSGFAPETVLEDLYQMTPLRDTVRINLVALVDGQPKTLSLVKMIEHFVRHILDVTVRRAEFARAKAAARAHILEGLLSAVRDINEVVATIQKSRSRDTAQKNLRKLLKVDEIQADAILDMRLVRLTGLELGRLKTELAEQKAIVKDRERLLASPKLQRKEAGDTLSAAASPLIVGRRTDISSGGSVDVATAPATVSGGKTSTRGLVSWSSRPKKPQWAVTADGSLLSVKQASGADVVGWLSGSETVMAVTNQGQAVRVQSAGLSRGGKLKLEDGEQVIAAFDAPDGGVLATAASNGKVGQYKFNDFRAKQQWQVTLNAAMGLDGDHEVLAAGPGADDYYVALMLDAGQVQTIRLGGLEGETAVPFRGRGGGGVNGVPTGAGRVIAAYVGPDPMVDCGDGLPRALAADLRRRKPTQVGAQALRVGRLEQ